MVVDGALGHTDDVLTALRFIARLEATSYLVLLAAVAVKYLGGTAAGVTVVGPVHGVLYLGYVAAVAGSRDALAWPLPRAVTAMAMGALPFGGFVVERSWLPSRSEPTS